MVKGEGLTKSLSVDWLDLEFKDQTNKQTNKQKTEIKQNQGVGRDYNNPQPLEKVVHINCRRRHVCDWQSDVKNNTESWR